MRKIEITLKSLACFFVIRALTALLPGVELGGGLELNTALMGASLLGVMIVADFKRGEGK